MDLAGFIAQAVERTGLSFRKLEQRAEDLDHAYIWRLAKGTREAPSDATVKKLAGALQLDERESMILSLLVKGPIDDALVDLMRDRRDIPWEDFEPVATMSFRGTKPTTREGWLKWIETVRNL